MKYDDYDLGNGYFINDKYHEDDEDLFDCLLEDYDAEDYESPEKFMKTISLWSAKPVEKPKMTKEDIEDWLDKTSYETEDECPSQLLDIMDYDIEQINGYLSNSIIQIYERGEELKISELNKEEIIRKLEEGRV